MRFSRLVLLVVAAAAIAGVVVPAASALTFVDEICPVKTGDVIKICPTGFTGKAYSLQLKGRDGTGCVPYVKFKAVGALPDGLTLSSDGWITGTPTHAGEWTFWVQMQDIPASEGGVSWCGDNNSTERQFQITIIPGLQIVQRQSNLTPAQLNTTYNLQFSTTGGVSPTWSFSGALPAGITLSSSTGLLSGTPTATGDYSFKITATDGSRSDTQTYTLSVVQKLQIGPAKGVAEVGIPYALTPRATGGKPGYKWSLGGSTTLPAGLVIDPVTGAISGTPTTAGTSTTQLLVTDSLGLTVTLNLPFTVAPPLLITRKALRAATVGSAYHTFFRARGGVVPRSWTMLGGRPGLLPHGMKLNAKTGELSGTPTKAGTYRLRIQVSDKLGAHSAAGFVLKVGA